MQYSNSHKKIKFVFITAAVGIGFFVALTFWNMYMQVKESNSVSYALKNLYYLENVLSDVQAIETGQRGFVITGKEIFLFTYYEGLHSLDSNVAMIRNLKLPDTTREADRRRLLLLIQQKVAHVNYVVALRKKYSLDSAAAYVSRGDGELIMRHIRSQVTLMENKDRLLLSEANEKTGEVATRTKWQFSILAMVMFIILFSNYFTIKRDLDRRLIQQKILEYNSSLIGSISDPIISMDNEYNIVSWNKHAEHTYGWNEKEVKGRQLIDFLKCEYVLTTKEEAMNSLQKEGSWKGEVVHYTKANKPIHIQCSFSLIRNEEGNQTGIVSIMTDITKRKEAEAQLHEITTNLEHQVKVKVGELNNVFERITDAFIALDINWCYTYVNGRAAELHGKPASELIGKKIWELYPRVVNEAFYNALQTARKTMQPSKLQLYYSQTDQWFEDLIYPSPDGLSVYYHDITQRKKAEILLERAHEKLSYHINNTPMAFVEMDENLALIQWSNKAEFIFGWSAEEVINGKLKASEIMHPDDREKVYSEFRELLHGDKQANVLHNRNIRKDGKVIYCEWYNSVLKDDNGRVTGMMSLAQDVTERTETQMRLVDSEERFRNLVEANMVGVYIIQNGKFLYINPKFAEIFGYSVEYIVGNFSVLDLVAEEDKNIVIENLRRRLNNEVKSINYEFRGVSKSGELLNIEVYGTRTVLEGIPSVIGTLIDITQRKKAMRELEESEKKLSISNERFLLVAKATNDAVWDWDIINDKIWGNEPFHNIFDSGSGDKIDYSAFISRIHPDDVSSMAKTHRDTLRNKRTSLNEEFQFRMADGSYKALYNRAYILYDEQGKAYRLIGAMQDITEQKLAQKQLLLEKQLSDSIINSLPGVFYLFNQSGQYLRWNNNFEKVTGYTHREIAGLHPLDLFAEEDKELIRSKIENVFKSGEDKVEAKLKIKNGDVIPYYFTGMIINYEGETCLMGVGLDISEKVQSQKQLIRSEENFRNLIDQASDGIFISDQNGDYQVVNRSACLLTGYSREELLSMNIRDLIHEDDVLEGPVKFEELSSGQIIISERPMKRKDGSKIFIEISAKLLNDGRFQGIVRDITARKKAEEVLRDSEEKRRLIMNAALDAIINIDVKGHVTFWNPQAEHIFGWKAGEVYGKLLSDIIIPKRLHYENDKGLIKYLLKEENEALNKVVEQTAVNRKGDEFPIELVVLPIKQKNESFFCVFIRDITQRKHAEEEIRISEHKYRLLFDQNPLPMWMMSLPGKNFIDVNEAAVEYYGYSKQEFLTMNIKDIRPENKSEESSDIISTYKSGIHNTGVWQHQKKDGTLVKVSLITHDIIYEGKHAKLVLANDVTEKIVAEEKLKSSYSELRELATHLQSVREAERTHMAREIHDELGQQLTGLKMDIAWIGKKLNGSDIELREKMDETLELIDITVKTVRRIATQLRPSILDDLGIIAALEWHSEEFQKRSKIECVFNSNVTNLDLPTDLATGFFRIYQESLTNVARHSKGSKVETKLLYKDGLIILTIVDNGVGFNASEIENKKTLGLLGMKERTLMMGGTYEVISKPGQGTRVVIVVPIQNNLT